MTTRSLSAAATTLAALAVGLATPTAHAHHSPGHGASEGVRTINSLGGTGGRARTRLMLLNEVIYTGQGLNPGVTYLLSLYGEYAPIPALSIAAQAPLQVNANQIDDYKAQAGYGDTRVSIRVTPHARKLTHRVLSTGVNVSFPTRTVRFAVDPGRVWAVSPYVMFTRTYTRMYWQLIGLSTLDIRPAGIALDFSAGGQMGSTLLDGKVSAGLGLLAEMRLANWHALVGGGHEFSTETRPSEGLPGSADERPVGATRLIGMINVSWNVAKWGSLIAAVQLPLTAKQDFTLGGSLGFQVFF